MWSTERFNSLNPSQSDNQIEAKQLLQGKDGSQKLVAYYNTPQKGMDCQNRHIPFDFNFFFGNFLTSENKPNNNQQDSAALANRFYSNYKFKLESSDESHKKYLTSNQYDPFKNSLEKMTPISDLKTGQFNQEGSNQIGKRNLFSIFEKAKNESDVLRKDNSNDDNDNSNNDNNIDIEKEEKNFLNSPPRTTVTNAKRKNIFECSGSSTFCSTMKKKRFRKNNNQIKSLSIFYQRSKNWSKEQIKEISNITELAENKVYKWLWDQKNKELKKAKFVVVNK